MKNIDKSIHFLGIGNISRSIVLFYASKYFKHPITFDSSSYDIGTQYRWYLLPMMSRKIRFVNPQHIEDDMGICGSKDVVYLDNANDICDCVVCRHIGSNLGKMIKENDPLLGGLLSVHNLIVNVRHMNYIKQIIDNDYKLREYVNFNFEKKLAEKILNAFDIIDTANEKGPEFALNKYKDVMGFKKEVGQQKNIFNY